LYLLLEFQCLYCARVGMTCWLGQNLKNSRHNNCKRANCFSKRLPDCGIWLFLESCIVVSSVYRVCVHYYGKYYRIQIRSKRIYEPWNCL